MTFEDEYQKMTTIFHEYLNGLIHLNTLKSETEQNHLIYTSCYISISTMGSIDDIYHIVTKTITTFDPNCIYSVNHACESSLVQ